MSVDPSSEPDTGLDQAETLVVRIFDFIASDKSRLARFLKVSGLDRDALEELGKSHLSFFSVLDSVEKDQPLLVELETHEHITGGDIAMARARLAFQTAAATAGQGRDDATEAAIRNKVKDLLRALSRLMQDRKAVPRRSASRK